MSLTLVAGAASAPALVLDEPLSLWGGLDRVTGEIVDQHHPQAGVAVGGRVLVMPSGRGSSGGSGILAEVVRAGVGPVGVVLATPDPILVVGGVVIGELYPDLRIPIVVAEEATYRTIRTGDLVTITSDGEITIG